MLTSSIEPRVIDDPAVRKEVFAHLASQFRLNIHAYSPVFLGLYHRKWIVETSSGKLFVKCYHPKRYPLNDPERRAPVARSLGFQQLLHERTGICPGVWSYCGESICQSESGHFYVVMQHADGLPPKSGAMSASTMHRFGRSAGSMHAALAAYPAEGTHWAPSLPLIQDKWRTNLDHALAQTTRNERAIQAIERQGLILSELDMSLFGNLEPGWAHWDLWADNILVNENGGIRIVDFDTVQFGYPEIDIARAILSGALHEGRLREEAALAFLDGYRQVLPLPHGRLPLALKLLWCREAHWWLKADMDDFSIPPKRFAEEMIWLTGQWRELDDLIGNW